MHQPMPKNEIDAAVGQLLTLLSDDAETFKFQQAVHHLCTIGICEPKYGLLMGQLTRLALEILYEETLTA